MFIGWKMPERPAFMNPFGGLFEKKLNEERKVSTSVIQTRRHNTIQYLKKGTL